jgi:LmbE family N-acetylglucosaminyl deacetylase
MPHASVISRLIFLSPHPDDAVLSCGGWINQLVENGERPIVMTTLAMIFGMLPLAFSNRGGG